MPAFAEAPAPPPPPPGRSDTSSDDKFCGQVSNAVSSFVDSFVDFIVGGQILSKHAQSSANSFHPAAGAGGEARNHGGDSGMGIVTRIPAVERLVAIGDIHGDLAKTRESLRIAGVVDEDDRWIGGKTVVVQVGDVLDRGGQELKVLYLLERLKGEAQRHGGDLHIMNGNHEVMNIEGDFRYATKEALDEFSAWAQWYRRGQALKERCHGLGRQPDAFRNVRKSIPDGVRARYAALRPGGPISSRFLAHHPTILIVGSTVFAHGGILPSHLDYGLEKINAEVRDWIQGRKGRQAPGYLRGKDAVVWARQYSIPVESLCDCKLLDEVLTGISGASRMVVGHTIQAPFGINSACQNQVFRVDVGMSSGCANTAPEVLEIRHDTVVRVLSKEKEKAPPQAPPGLASILDRGKSPILLQSNLKF
ncbi:shewanella-like protein phosphatase 2 [Selaginella moellendorffii]|nr:shewanella-like protein phosphatase 2 [Selaginella moellendorffii]|eukprot:XP_002963802.2 shewanella-like protein phosphatase 2 [Selaginella moellendorffii]